MAPFLLAHPVQILQGRATTDLRRGGERYANFLRSSSQKVAVKELLKLVHICQNYP